jgi:hypothetical protein
MPNEMKPPARDRRIRQQEILAELGVSALQGALVKMLRRVLQMEVRLQ